MNNDADVAKKTFWDRVKGFGAFAFLLAVFGGGYAAGEKSAERGAKETLSAAQGECSLKLLESKQATGTKEQELRDCISKASALQAVVALSQSDRDRLIALTTIAPPLKVTIDGHPLAGRVVAGTAIEPGCRELRFWFENTGQRDLRIEGVEWVTAKNFSVQSYREGISHSVSVPLEGDPLKNRHWIEGNFPLPPGSRRYVVTDFCDDPDAPRDAPGVFTVSVTGGFLPLRLEWTLGR